MKYFCLACLSLCVIFLLLFGIYLLLGYLGWHFAMSRKSGLKKGIEFNSKRKRMQEDIDYFKDYKVLDLNTFDNLRLKGFYKDNNFSKLAIVVHGYGGCHYDVVKQCQIFEKAGYDIFTLDLRAHGESEGDALTMGLYESQDLLSWIEQLSSFKDYRIALYGISMGASTVLLSASDKKAKNIQLAIEDCGYDNANREFSYIFAKSKIKRKWLYRIFYKYTKQVKKIDLRQIDIAKSIKNLKMPVLFIHGDKDEFVPTEMVYTLFDSVGTDRKSLYIAKDATHGNAYEVNPKLYEQKIYTFLNKYGM